MSMKLRKRILIIDDDLDMCTLLSRFLQRKGYETGTAHNGASLAKFKKRITILSSAISGRVIKMEKKNAEN